MKPIAVVPYTPGTIPLEADWMESRQTLALESQIAAGDPAYEGRDGEGRLLWCCGLQVHPEDRRQALAWLVVRPGAAREYGRTFAEVRRVLEKHRREFRMVYGAARMDAPEYGRFLEHLGFAPEPQAATGADGRLYSIYGLGGEP